MANTVLAKMAVEISANTARFNAGLEKAGLETKRFQNRIESLGKNLLGAFAVIDIGRQMIEVTSQFQKFEAVLTNTLGSNSDAQQALQSIRDFALRTPFEVSEITAAYVRWTNQGLTPSIQKMKMLGDVASSLGAGFEQTAEAFKDLAVGQTRRLEEIGISAQQSNGKIQLSFKGVNIEIEKNAKGVEEALRVYSQLPGVLGSTEAVAQTLGGRISNLKDAWDNFLLTLGQSNTGILFSTVQSLTNLLVVFSNLGSELEILGRQVFTVVSPIAAYLLKLNTDIDNVSESTFQYLFKLGKTQAGKPIADLVASFEQNRTSSEQYALVLKNVTNAQQQFSKAFEGQGEDVKTVNRLWKTYLADLKTRADFENKQAAKAKEQGIAEKKKADDAAAATKKEKDDAAQLLALKEAQKQKLKEEEEAWKNLMKVRSMSFEELKKQYKEQNAIEVAPGLFDIQSLGQLKAPDLSNYVKSLKPAIEATNQLRLAAQELNQAFSDSASQGLQDFFVGIGDVANKQISFGDNLLKAIAGFMKQFGQNLIALGIGKIGLDNLFKTGFGGPAAIAAGVALVSAAGAISKGLAKKSQSIGSGGSGGSSSGFSGQTISAAGSQSNIQITGKLVGSGRDLVAVINNTSFDNSQRKGG
jgi:hypothetical protein